MQLFYGIVVIILCSITSIVGYFSGTLDHVSITKIREKTIIGTFLGIEAKSDFLSGKTIKIFSQIPYAKPPIGELRFKDPVPIEYNVPDKEVGVQSDDMSSCPAPRNSGTEDCLHLQVLTSNFGGEKLQPVLVIIHQGGFYVGSTSDTKQLQWMAWFKDFVVVTLNYRLSFLGFSADGTSKTPGNAGLKDQVMAMRWVKKYISNFGGDPNNVILNGYSAGAMSVALHLISPMSVGLFHRAMIMSGGIPPQTKYGSDQVHLIERFLDRYKCSSTLMNWTDCFNNETAIEYSEDVYKMFEFGHDNPIYLWMPVIEKDFGQERFLTEDPLESMRKGDFQRIQVFTGFTSHELHLSGRMIADSKDLLEQFKGNFSKVAPICLLYQNFNGNTTAINDELESMYFHKGVDSLNATPKSAFDIADLFSDAVIGFPVYYTAKLLSKFTDVFFYYFSYNTSDDGLSGPEHFDDYNYLEYNNQSGPLYWKPMFEYFMQNNKLRVKDENNTKFIDWIPMEPDNEWFVDLNTIPQLKKNFKPERYSRWLKLFPLSNN